MVSTEKELAQSLKENKSTIEIEGDLCRKVIRIKATGKLAWGVALAAITVAVVATLSSGGMALPVSGVVAGAATGILGVGATTCAISLAVAAGGVAVLNKLRSYKVEKISDTHIKLFKK